MPAKQKCNSNFIRSTAVINCLRAAGMKAPVNTVLTNRYPFKSQCSHHRHHHHLICQTKQIATWTWTCWD